MLVVEATDMPATDLSIRPLVKSDLVRILPLERASFTDAWPHSFFREVLAEPGAHALVAEVGQELVGYAMFLMDPPESHLINLAVAPAFRRKSVASQLLAHILMTVTGACCDHVMLEVRPGNAGAIAFYHRHGFRLAYRLEEYYRSPVEDALVMVRYLDGEKQKT